MTDTQDEKKEAATTNPPPSIDPVDFAAKEFNMGIGPFKSALDRFSKKELIRVLSFIVEAPLNDKPYKFVDKRAKYLADLGNHLIMSKVVMMQEVYKNKEKEKKDERSTEKENHTGGGNPEEQKGHSLSQSKE